MRGYPELGGMVALKRGNRLSITPVTEREWKFIVARLDG
jgi:predicted RNA-binding protein with PUA-like domain